MSLISRIYLLPVLALFLSTGVKAQLFTDQGVMSGSGLTVMPTATVMPTSELRLQYTRVNHFMQGKNGINVIGVGCGLSSTLEGYIRVSGEQSGAYASQVTYGFGGKFRFPMLIPAIRRLALWMESTNTDAIISGSLYPSDAFRTGVVATFDSNGIHPSLLLGIATIGGKTRPLIGTGVTVATSHTTQVGFEAVYGYLKSRSFQIAATGSAKIFPNISLHVSPGYVTSTILSSWSFSVGISCSTADIDFHPVVEEQAEEEFIVPSFEDIEKQSVEEKKDE